MPPHPPAKALLCLLLVINVVLYSSSSRFSPTSAGLASTSSSSLPIPLSASQPVFRRTSPVLRSLSFQPRLLPYQSADNPSDSSSSGQSSLSSESTPSDISIQFFPFPAPADPPKNSKKKWVLVPPLLLYTVFLLAFLGICAGDFLVPNLATIADSLGLSDNTAGVTLLALGNGSPDVFSTYASFRSSSGTLAIGELLGAASFIVSVVVGSMALVKPFKVHPGPFLRDVGFAITAVGMMLCVLWDEQLTFLETAMMVLLYVFYVVWVVGGTWWMARRREGKIRLEEDDGEGNLLGEGGGEPYFDEDDQDHASIFDAPLLPSSLLPSSIPTSPTHRPVLGSHQSSATSSMNSSTVSLLEPASAASPDPNHLLTPEARPKLQIRTSSHVSNRSNGAATAGVLEDEQSQSRTQSYSRPRRSRANSNSSGSNIDVRRTPFSLLGAVEFRDVVNSLMAEGADLEGVPNSPFASGHYHSHHPNHTRSNSVHNRRTASPIITTRRSFHADQQQSSASSSKRKSLSKFTMSTPSSTSRPDPIHTVTAPQSPRLDPIVTSEPERSASDPTRLSTEASVSPHSSTAVGSNLDDEINPWSEVLGTSPKQPLKPLPEPTQLLKPPPVRSNTGRPRSQSEVPSINLYEPPSDDPSEPLVPSSLAPPSPNSSASSDTARPHISSPSSSPLTSPTPSLFHPKPSTTLRNLFLPTPQQIKRGHLMHFLRLSYHTFFPSLQSFRHKSWVGRLLSLLAVPAILALTLTLCVVDNQADGAGSDGESDVEKREEGADGSKAPSVRGEDHREEEEEDMVAKVGHTLHARTVHAGEDPSKPSISLLPSYNSPHQYEGHLHPAHLHPQPHSHLHPVDVESTSRYRDDETESGEEAERQEEEAEYQLEEEMRREEEEEDTSHVLKFNKWLTAVQCGLGPCFVAGVLFSDSPDWLYPTLALAIPGSLIALLVLFYSTDGRHPVWRLSRCLLGFSVAMVWIMTIADEVVNVLTALGEIFGLSDAIIGLTIFAIGNSTADLVANLSIASFAPIMAFSACFGGPMLNILLGVGFSGAFVTFSTGRPYPLDFSPTLMTSITGLLALLAVTIVFVPLNGFVISRKWGAFLIFSYICSMVCNILAEVYLEE